MIMTFRQPRSHVRDSHLRHLPSERFRFIAVDVETAGRSVSSICQIGLAFVGLDGTIRTYSTLIDPGVPFAPRNIAVHGIEPADVRGAPRFCDVIAKLRPVLEDHMLVQHSRFDERAFDGACRAIGQNCVDAVWTDSVKIARQAWPELRGNGGHGLANLRKVLGLKFQHHDAGEDARAAAQVVLAAEERLGPIRALRPKPVQLRFAF